MAKRSRRKQPKERHGDLVSIVIPVYGRLDLLDKCLASIPAAMEDIPYNIIVVDNNSPVDTKAFYDKWSKEITLVRNQENEGFARACNKGANRKTSPLIFFLNSDVILDPGSVPHLVRALDDPEVGVVGMKLIFPMETDLMSNDRIRKKGTVQHVGMATDIQGNFLHIFNGWDENNSRVQKVREVYAVTGAALMTRRNLFVRVRGFDLEYGAGTWEDVDYCLAVRSLGYNVIVEQKARGIHYTGASTETYRIPFPQQLNQLVFLSKWGDKLNYTLVNHY